MDSKPILIIGNSDGIGLATTKLLLNEGRHVVGISRSPSPITHDHYTHNVCDVLATDYIETLEQSLQGSGGIETCIFCVGVGNEIEDEFWLNESKTVEINLISMIKTLETLLPTWLEEKQGHFIGLSSLADVLRIPDGGSYSASKAGFSNYLESLGFRLSKTGVKISNVRFGFVDTKMAHAPVKPCMITPDAAAKIIRHVMNKKPLRHSRPLLMVPLVRLLGFAGWLQAQWK